MPAAFMFTAGQDYPVIAVAQTLSRAGSAAAWAIYARLANDGRELAVAFGASRRLGGLEVSRRQPLEYTKCMQYNALNTDLREHPCHPYKSVTYPKISTKH